nr:putative disease resistance protein RGA4 [Quercus suber]XP_023890114.1 putative disease resistance protein RGA4 [Quercus suber]XP_023890115.1 putative disease resistance protein RGA4 [Quercus suber]XP_023890116.1 putative disease resistance protein RGA4 [Quercus suber]
MTELVYSIASNVIDKIGSLAYQEICLAGGISEDMKKLELTMSIIHAVLLDAEEKQVKNRGLTVWLGQLKDVFHEATDVLDEFECEALRRQVVKTSGNTSNQVPDSISYSSFNLLGFGRKMSHKIKGIRESLEELAKVRALFNLEERSEDQNIVHREREMTHSFVPDSDVIGRVDDKRNIIDLLMHPGNNSNVSVIFIVGMGGLGKTTLAQWVYNDERIATNFDSRVWVCVSEDYSVLKLAKEILKSAGGGSSENMSMDLVQASLRSILKGKRYFIVLDDVWNEDRHKWIDLKNLLIGGQGSKILVTTRSHRVASIMAPGPIHELKGLPHNDCLSLFLRCAFNEGEHEQYPKLVDIGKQVVEKCKGVPLAVKTLGSLLYSKTQERDWISIRDNEIWKLEQKETDILPALRLSYNKLPSDLKQCFAYCSLYPKDFRYNKGDLIQCWMANGLLKKSNKSTEEMEDIGEQYMKELLSRSFIQEVQISNPCWWSFKMHDLLHDLSLYVAQNDYCLIEDTNNTNNFEKARHVSILDHKWGVDATITFLHKLSNNLRTINFSFDDRDQFAININESLVETCISRFKHLRLLNLRNSTLETLSSSISTLKHLRYLNLRGNKKIKKLPDSICNLQNLETLILFMCEEIEELPRDIRKMVSLRHFVITTKQTRLPANGIECMSSLRHLSFYSCHRLECFNEGIQRLAALRHLSFINCKSLISLPQGMKHLTALEYLRITICEKLNLMEVDDYPTSLQTLHIGRMPQLVSLPQGLKGFADTLQYLCIFHCKNLGVLPEWLPDLSSLRKLEILVCRKLSSLPEGMDRLTALRELTIYDCPELRRDYEREVGKDWGKMVKFTFD